MAIKNIAVNQVHAKIINRSKAYLREELKAQLQGETDSQKRSQLIEKIRQLS